MFEITQEPASAFARLALGHVTREYPNRLDHVLAGPEDACTPRALHPIFYGSFDWHSCVHAWWMLAHLLRRFPAMPEAPMIRALFDQHLTTANVAVEATYLDRPTARGFERPYGWAWFLKLASELRQHEAGWAAALAPMTDRFIARFQAFLPLATYPIRAGVHTNTAFAVRLAWEYPDEALRSALTEAAYRWYANDRDCQAWEPSGDEFLSPTLIEAECMRAVMPEAAFRSWFTAFLPHLPQGNPRTLFFPAIVSDRTDGKIAHLDGLNLSRAWCWRALAPFTPDPAIALAAAEAHFHAGLPHIGDNYMGEHWLASFVVLALA